MTEEYELRPVRYHKLSGQALVTIPKNSPLYGLRFVKVLKVKE